MHWGPLDITQADNPGHFTGGISDRSANTRLIRQDSPIGEKIPLLFRYLQPLLFQVDDSGGNAFDVAFNFFGGPLPVPVGEGLVYFGVALLVIEF
jgi:hypothetical protein